MPQIFLSYPHESTDVVKLLVPFLRAHGAESISIDIEKVFPGDYVTPKLQEAVRTAACCVLVLNSYSRNSPWCMAEVGAFWGASKPIIVYPTEPRCDLPPYLAGIRTAKDLEELATACKALSQEVSSTHADDPLSAALSNGGLRHAFRIPLADHHRELRVQQLVDTERGRSDLRRFRLLASSGYNYLHPNGKVWRAGLCQAIEEEEANLIAILESPFSPFSVTRALANGVTYHHWKEKLPFEVLTELDDRPNVEIRVTDHPVNCSLFFNSESVFYDPYLWGRPGSGRRTENNFWVFEFEHLPGLPEDCYGLLLKHFDFLCQHSVSLVEFLHDGREGYENKSRAFSENLQQIQGRGKK
jgi:hypothetical protein